MPSATWPTSNLKGDLLSVKMLGVIPNGTTDNYAALQTAINSASAAGSPILYFPVGAYKVVAPANGVITVPANLRLVGAYGSSILYKDDGNSGNRALFKFNGDNSGIENLTIDAEISVAPVGQNGADILQIGAANNVTIAECHINGHRDSSFQNTNGIQFIGNCDGVNISNCTFEQLWYGFYRASSNTNTHKNVRVIGNKFYRNFGDDANFNCPGNPGGENSIVVIGNNFADNQSNTPVGGFGVSSANCQLVGIANNSFSNYQREAVHVELSSYVAIASNTFSAVGQVDFAAIQVIASTHHLAITGNVVNCTGNSVADAGIAVQPGGVSACLKTVVADNIVDVSSTMTGLLLVSSTDLAVTGNIVTGPGSVSGGAYTGGTNVGIELGGVVRSTISGNLVEGFGAGIGSTNTAILVADQTTLSANEVYGCNVGLALKACGQMVIDANVMTNCVHPTAFGATTVVPLASSFIGNKAIGCVNRVDFYDNMSATNSLIADNFDDVSGATVGLTVLNGGYGSITGFPGNLLLGGGAPSGPKAGSLTWGQGTGFTLEFATTIGGVYTPVVYIDDLGNIIWVGLNPSGGILSFQKGKFTEWVGAGATIPISTENLTTGSGGINVQGPAVFPFVTGGHPLKLNGSGVLIASSLVDLTSDVVNVLPVGNGGTGHSGYSPDGFLQSISNVISTVAGITNTVEAVATNNGVSNTFVTSINFTAQTYTTAFFSASQVTTQPHTVTNGLIVT